MFAWGKPSEMLAVKSKQLKGCRKAVVRQIKWKCYVERESVRNISSLLRVRLPLGAGASLFSRRQ